MQPPSACQANNSFLNYVSFGNLAHQSSDLIAYMSNLSALDYSIFALILIFDCFNFSMLDLYYNLQAYLRLKNIILFFQLVLAFKIGFKSFTLIKSRLMLIVFGGFGRHVLCQAC